MSSTQASTGDSNKPQALINGSVAAEANVQTPKASITNHRPASSKKTSKTNKGGMQKSAEDLQDEVMELKKSMAALAEENTVLKAKSRRIEEDNLRKNDELKKANLDKKSSSTSVVMNNLKHKVFKLEQSLKEKDAVLKKLESESQSSKVHEMKLQMDAYYREIIRLKNLNNLRETARTTNEDSIQQVLISNKELEEENQTLRKDLERALAINRSQLQCEYANMSKTQLLGIITELENKLNVMTSAEQKSFVDSDLSVDGLKLQLHKLSSETQQLQTELQKVKEDRLHYHDLADSREQELKALRLLIEHMQKQVETKPSSSTSGPRKAPAAAAAKPQRSQTEQTTARKVDGTVFDRLASSPRSAQSSPRHAAKPTGSGSGSNGNADVKKKPSKVTVGQRVPLKSSRPPTTAQPQANKEALGAKPLASRAKAASPKSPSAVQLGTRRDLPAKAQVKEEPKTARKEGKATGATKKKRPTSATKMSPDMRPQEVAGSSVSTTTYVKSEAEVETMPEPKPKELVRADVAANPIPANKTVTYTVLKTLKMTTDVKDATNKKAEAKPIKSPRANEKQINDFRQNVAAKKIQKMWKHHQVETHTQNRQRRVHNFQQNHAARTIQRGWKKHTQKTVVPRNPHDQVNGELLIDFSSAPANYSTSGEYVDPAVASSPLASPQNHAIPDDRDGTDNF